MARPASGAAEGRRRIGRRAPAAALALALGAAPAGAQVEGLLGQRPPAAAPETPEPPIPVDSPAPSDERIVGRLRAIFGAVEALSGVAPRAASGVVTLEGAAPDAASAEAAVELAGRLEGVVTVVDRIERGADLQDSLVPGLERLERRLREGVRLLPVALAATALFALFAALGRLLGMWGALYRRLAPNAFVAELAAGAVRVGFIGVGLVAALEFAGASGLLGAILGAAGILGLAVGFAVRDTIENYVASILLSVRQPFAPNDLVRIDEREGFVLRLTSRATVLLTMEGNHVRIPNATVFKSTIVNFTQNPERRFDFALGVNADASLKDAIETGVGALAGLGFTLADPPPAAWIETVGDSSVVIRFVGWIDQRGADFFQARSEAIRLVKRALEDAGFELPEPIYRLRLDEGSAAGEPRGAEAPTAEPPEPADTRRRAAVEEKVTQERRRRADDLLTEGSPRE